jgi:hypothetical protein
MSKTLGKPGEPLPLIKNPNVSARQFNAVVRNYINVHEALDRVAPKLRKDSESWYERAHEQAARIGKLAGGDVHTGSGIIAALSPMNNWGQNLKDAEQLARTGSSGNFPPQVAKARRILEGENPLDVLKGLKERPFHINISNPEDPSITTVDRHANDQGLGREMGKLERGLGAAGRVSVFNNAMITASHSLGIPVPSRFQAGLWGPWSEGIRPTRANNFLIDYPSPDAADAHVQTSESPEPGPGLEST